MSATTEIAAPPARVFDVLADTSRHAEIDGSGTVLGRPDGPTRLFLGAEFTMGMRQLGRRYRSANRVVEFEEGRRVTWETHGVRRGRPVVGGQRWRWTLTPSPVGTVVQHTYIWGYARLPLLTVWLPRYPARARRALPGSLRRLNTILSPVEPSDDTHPASSRSLVGPPRPEVTTSVREASRAGVPRRAQAVERSSRLPWLVFDGDCAFCTTAVSWLGQRLRRPGRPDPRIVPWQQLDRAACGVSEKRARQEVSWVASTGTVAGGAAAVASWLQHSGGAYGLLGRALGLPLVRHLADRAYRLVARNRHRMPGGTPACALTDPAHPTDNPVPERTSQSLTSVTSGTPPLESTSGAGAS